MAMLQIDGLDELLRDLLGAEKLPVDEMLNAGADVAVAAQKSKADAMLQGPYNKGAVMASIRKYGVVKTSSGGYIKIAFPGSQHGNSITEIAYINEYGKTNQPARPFISTANEESAGDVAVAEYHVYDKHLRKHNL